MNDPVKQFQEALRKVEADFPTPDVSKLKAALYEAVRLLQDAGPRIPSGMTQCCGYKCREAHCFSCFDEEDAQKAAEKNDKAYKAIKRFVDKHKDVTP